MKKVFCFVVLLCFGLLFAEVNKEDFFQKLAEKYKNANSVKSEIVVNMDMMEKLITIPVKFFKKDKKIKMELIYQQPGMEKPMEIVMIMDKEKMLQYQKTINTVIKFDFSKFPEDMKEEMEKKYDFERSVLPDIGKFSENIEVNEKTKEGKSFYMLTVKNLQKLVNEMPAIKSQNAQFFTRAVAWFYRDLTPERISLYTDSEKVGMEIIFKSLVINSPVADDEFEINIPEDAKVIDMTDMMINMMKAIKEQQTQQKEQK